MRGALWVCLFLAACSSKPPRCSLPDEILVEDGGEKALCSDLEAVRSLIDVLVGEGRHDGLSASLQRDGEAAFKRSHSDYRAGIAWARVARQELSRLSGPQAAIRRSEIASEVLYDSPLPARTFGDSYARFVRVWVRSEVTNLVLTERDIEGWIYLASLSAEADGRSPLKISIAGRLQVYNQVTERFSQGSEAERRALVSVGAFWDDMRARWQGATYERQQAWIAEAPRPVEKLGSDSDYFDAFMKTDVALQARLIHAHFGPLRLNLVDD